jgi:predicted kinase
MNNFKKTMVILRGISGSGKSTKIKEIVKDLPEDAKDIAVCSADFYFIGQKASLVTLEDKQELYRLEQIEQRQYKFDPNELSKAHEECFRSADYTMRSNHHTIFIDNTNTTRAEITPYIMLAKLYNYDVKIIRMEAPVRIAANRNVHNVPKGRIEAQYERFEDLLLFDPPEEVCLGYDFDHRREKIVETFWDCLQSGRYDNSKETMYRRQLKNKRITFGDEGQFSISLQAGYGWHSLPEEDILDVREYDSFEAVLFFNGKWFNEKDEERIYKLFPGLREVYWERISTECPVFHEIPKHIVEDMAVAAFHEFGIIDREK